LFDTLQRRHSPRRPAPDAGKQAQYRLGAVPGGLRAKG
jgi:hypothetical protein